MYNTRFNKFTYYEKLDEKECIDFPKSLMLNGSPTSESILFRLLLGSINFKQEDEELLYEQNVCYTKITDTFDNHLLDNPIIKWINNEFGLSDLDNYFKKNRKNQALFDELLAEFTLYFYFKKKENFTSAFLHLYRSLEFISYSFPLVYSSSSSNFYTSFDTFQNFFSNKERGQLKFFREFVSVLFEDRTLRCKLKIDTYVNDDLLDKRKLTIIKSLCKDFDFSNNGSVVSIEYRYLLDFMINLRNKYFHFEYDRTDNISNINFNSESFFESLNDQFANWLSMIYLEILEHGVYKSSLLSLK